MAAGTYAQATYSAIWFGMAVMAPFLRHRYHLSLGETGVLISASLAGSVVSLVPWGYATDRFGERLVLIAGIGGCGAALLGVACVLAAAVGGTVIRDVPVPDDGGVAVEPLRDPRLWRIALGSALVVAPQMCVVGFTVLLLHDHRGLSAGRAAAVLAVVQALGIAGRIAAGRWSDVMGSRLAPLRAIALVDAGLVLVSAFVLDVRLAVLLPALVAAGVVAMSWNGLAFAAAIEVAGHRRSGVAIGLQQSVLNAFGAVYPGVFGVLVAGTSWRVGFVAVALLPVGGWWMLRELSG